MPETIVNHVRVFAFNGRYLVQPEADPCGWKTRGHVVAESVGGRWIKRSRGYLMSARQFEQFKAVMGVCGPVEVTIDRPSDCECDNTHEQNKTCCRPCWSAGFREVANA